MKATISRSVRNTKDAPVSMFRKLIASHSCSLSSLKPELRTNPNRRQSSVPLEMPYLHQRNVFCHYIVAEATFQPGRE
ncbi:hypothetical protein GJ744_009965 [Endocarpon pusillum]|uniref:Uncharacterized protein n=1 Tax=Endocarpon pusillum TaxID=364733 RepID=A0A8H7AIW4_9EURO|nr:hypothetical protein GJ744_009965 [Endocarpon pusillum]